MKLEDQVITIEQGMRLNKLGIIQKSLFYHIQDKTPTNPNLHHYGCQQAKMQFRITHGQQSILSGANIHFEFSAFTVSELGEMLPYRLRDAEKNENPHLRIYRGENEWSVEYHQTFSRPYVQLGDHKNLAEAMGYILIHLLENDLTTIEEVNQRLLSK